MKKIFNISFAFILFFLANITVNAEALYDVEVTGSYEYDFARGIFEGTNKEREKEGLSLYKYDKELTEAAMLRAKEISLYFSHTRPNDTSCFTAFPSNGQTTYGENIISGYPSPESTVEGWMNSEGHRANILNPDFTVIGIGCFRASGYTSCVQLFTNQPKITDVVKTGSIEAKNETVSVSSKYVEFGINGFYDTGDNEIGVGSEVELSYKFINKGFTYLTQPLINKSLVILTSSNPDIFTVSNHTIIGKKEGKATLNATFAGTTKNYGISVVNKEIPIYGVDTDKRSLTLNIGSSYKPIVTIYPSNTTMSKKVTMTSSDEGIVKVLEDGNIVGVSPGTARITVKTVNNYVTYIDITVNDYRKGDMDGNGNIEIYDVMELLYIVSEKKEKTPAAIKIGDMDNSGDIDIFDVMELLYIYTGKK